MKRLMLAALAVCTVVLTACTGSNAVDQSVSGRFDFKSGTQLGQLYPQADRKLPDTFGGSLLNGGSFTSASTKGKIVVVNFWASWCIPCKTETPQFDLLYRKLKSQGVDFVGIDTKDDRGSAQAFVKDNDISYPMVYDEPGQTAVRLGRIPAASLPFTVLLDKQGKVAAVYIDVLSDKDLQPALDKLLAEK